MKVITLRLSLLISVVMLLIGIESGYAKQTQQYTPSQRQSARTAQMNARQLAAQHQKITYQKVLRAQLFNTDGTPKGSNPKEYSGFGRKGNAIARVFK